MKAAFLCSVNGKFEIRDIETPSPSSNQVLIKIHSSGLCYNDIHIQRGESPLQLHFPCILGHEPAGEVVEIGECVTKRKKGDRVGVPYMQNTCGRCEWCQRGKNMYCKNLEGTGVAVPGAHAEYMLAYEDSTVLLPNEIAYNQGAPLFCAGYAMYSGLRSANPKPHERIAVIGIGGLGHLGIQFSKSLGYYTIALTHSKDKEESIYSLGADQVIFSGKNLNSIGGADIILVTSSSYELACEAFDGLRPEGRWILMGISTDRLTISPFKMAYYRYSVIGSQQNSQEYLYEVIDLVAKGKVKVLTESYSLQDINQAYTNLANGNVRYRAVIEN